MAVLTVICKPSRKADDLDCDDLEALAADLIAWTTEIAVAPSALENGLCAMVLCLTACSRTSARSVDSSSWTPPEARPVRSVLSAER